VHLNLRNQHCETYVVVYMCCIE